MYNLSFQKCITNSKIVIYFHILLKSEIKKGNNKQIILEKSRKV